MDNFERLRKTYIGSGSSSNWRNPCKVGQIYKIPKGAASKQPDRYRLIEGDSMMCLKHIGDGCYDWGLLEQQTSNNEWFYFNIVRVFMAYSFNPEWEILQEPMTDRQLISALLSMDRSGSYGVLVEVLDDERGKEETRVLLFPPKEMKY